jgi:orotidine-5'-phosphate decarboxylase
VKAHERILVALDTPDRRRALDLAGALGGRVGGVKVGLELFSAAGPEIVRELRTSGVDVFLDLKLHDIPNTVAGAAAAAARLGVTFLTVHALGGPEMIRRGARGAAEAATEAGLPAPVVLAVTILTSHDDDDLRRLGVEGTGREAVGRLAGLAREAGAGGIVCSPLEIAEVRRAFPSATLVVPGIRPADLSVGRDDQARTATPAEAVRAGADRIVIGRPITAASDPVAAAEAIARGIDG